MTARHLLIVAHVPSPNTKLLREAVLRGAMNTDINDVTACAISPLEAGPDDLLAAHANSAFPMEVAPRAQQ